MVIHPKLLKINMSKACLVKKHQQEKRPWRRMKDRPSILWQTFRFIYLFLFEFVTDPPTVMQLGAFAKSAKNIGLHANHCEKEGLVLHSLIPCSLNLKNFKIRFQIFINSTQINSVVQRWHLNGKCFSTVLEARMMIHEDLWKIKLFLHSVSSVGSTPQIWNTNPLENLAMASWIFM